MRQLTPGAGIKHCVLVVDGKQGVARCELDLAASASIGAALAAARELLGEDAASWDTAATGIYGHVRPRDFVYAHGDRIEVYRLLAADPRDRRRFSAARVKSPVGR